MTGIFDGIRIVELATGIAAPYATMMLADHGADVIKVEAETGDPFRSEAGFETLNRNKRSVVVADDDLEALIASADVVVTDTPGHGAELKAAHPGLIVIAMPPWGERGPYVDQPSSPDLLAAATGVMWNQQSYTESPVQIVLPIVSYGTGLLGALAMASALVVAARDGAAPLYEVSEVAGSAAIQVGDNQDSTPIEMRPGDAPMGSKGRVPCYRLFEASDGKWFFLACGTARFYTRMLDVIGRPELIDDPLLPSPPWGLLDPAAVSHLAPILEDVFAARPRAEWIAAFAEADVPVQPVQTREEYLASSIVAANNLDVTVAHPELGEVAMMGVPLVAEAAPGRVERPAPLLGQHTDEVLAEVAAGSHEPRRGRGQGSAPLDGVSAIDLSSFIAGPVVSRHLAMLGADVIKVEPPGGDPFRAMGPVFAGWNQGKRSIVLDLGIDADRDVLYRLVDQADMVVENFRPNVASRLGIDVATLRERNADLVLLSSPGYGDDETMASAPAFDPLLQALGGAMAAQGGDGEPVFLTVPIHDVMTPMIGAFGLVSALYHREVTGIAQRVRASLAHTACAAQICELTRYNGAPLPAKGGFDHPGPDDHHRWEERDEGLVYVDGEHEVAIEQHGLVNSELAKANGLITTDDHPTFGPLAQIGQLIVGAGNPPARGPLLDEHRTEILADLPTPT